MTPESPGGNPNLIWLCIVYIIRPGNPHRGLEAVTANMPLWEGLEKFEPEHPSAPDNNNEKGGSVLVCNPPPDRAPPAAPEFGTEPGLHGQSQPPTLHPLATRQQHQAGAVGFWSFAIPSPSNSLDFDGKGHWSQGRHRVATRPL